MAAVPLHDTHAHLDDERFTDLSDVLARAAAAGVVRVNTIGIDAATSRAAVALADRHDVLSAVVGVQPNCVAEVRPGDWDAILELARSPSVVAIGETGLDRYWNRAPFEQQEEWFDRHLALARALGVPVVIHCREAEADVVRMLRAHFEKNGPVRGVMHSFTGDKATAAACLAMGLHLSFAGMLTYKKNAALREVAAAVPLDRLLVETDAPYLAPEPVRGKRCEPAFVVHTAACIATTRGDSPETIAAATTANAQALFVRS
jgi:TatD DNase family protein